MTDLGLRQPRLEGEEYLSVVDELMEAIFTRWPKAIVQVHFFKSKTIVIFYLMHVILLTGWMGKSYQFEDFQMKWAFETLQRYRKKFCMFNDDIQVSI